LFDSGSFFFFRRAVSHSILRVSHPKWRVAVAALTKHCPKLSHLHLDAASFNGKNDASPTRFLMELAQAYACVVPATPGYQADWDRLYNPGTSGPPGTQPGLGVNQLQPRSDRRLESLSLRQLHVGKAIHF